MPEFVALDGEGITRDGVHLYTLLSASTGAYIEDYDKGLGTVDCLEFVLSQRRKGCALVGFAINYDVTMMLKDLDRFQRGQLSSTGVVYVPTRSGFWYRVENNPHKTFRISWGTRFKSKTGKWRWVTLNDRSVTVYDVWGFFQSSFVAALLTWGIATKEELEGMVNMKESRATFDAAEKESIRDYNFDECVKLVALMTVLRDRLESVGLHLPSWHGAGAIASAILRKEGCVSHLPKSQSTPAMGSYFGARIQAVKLGHFEKVYTYDIRSAYPYAMSLLPKFELAEPERATDLGPFDVALIRWNSDARICPFPYRADSGSIQFYRSGMGYYHACEIFSALKAGTEIEMLEIWRIPHDDSVRPFAFIEDYYRYRAELRERGDYAHIALKLGLNSLYGKCAQRVGGYGKTPTYQSFWTAGAITAKCRSMLHDAALHNPDSIIMFATDGIASTRPLSLMIGTSLGEWDETSYDEFRIYQPGMYWMRKGDRVIEKTRSVPRKAIDWDALKAAWTVGGCRGSVEVELRQFIAYKSASVNRPYGSWIDAHKNVSLAATKGIPGSFVDQRVTLFPTHCPTPELVSSLYEVE